MVKGSRGQQYLMIVLRTVTSVIVSTNTAIFKFDFLFIAIWIVSTHDAFVRL